ncbi:secreted RxLR effector peptide protein, putative [Phytophthora infestans T30-4]|uniref:RxLR effector protein n=1 Tax=Phytophthora infestans (strain T30-4) TaxID=403677 RepID=D0NPQ2_PHYIT|nr:secreted RxLR effector peptide protein, putative [Phytophthora infestans T30-4]EEY62614.1 secreted RxLR effector peptide protein, putative [Phytophthora infestans T30-4]|eukprot:XP_002898856.1 secreted RxLR effector peptide protein, putative [Phytophthora infestans T30-4]
MRLAIILSATAVAISFATCSAIDQTKVLMYGTPAHYIHDSAGRRLLRKNGENKETSEERAPISIWRILVRRCLRWLR